jgi:peptidoglycan-associated lipoprotein
MTKTTIRGLFTASLAMLFLAGCGTTGTEDTSSADDASSQGPATEDTSMTRGVEQTAAPARVEREAVSINRRNNRVIIAIDDIGGTEELQGKFFFDFDQAIVKRSGFSELNKHAKALNADRTIRVRVEGHADERGTREYNMALAERRANAVRAYLVAQGASRSQIEVISFGEEKPAALGSNEAAWSKNRRVELRYR